MSEEQGNTGTAIVPLDTYAIARQDAASAAVIAENIGEGGMTVFDLDRIKVPAGGGRAWEIPTLTGDTDSARTVDGVIVAWRDPRAFWTVSLDESGGGSPPDCSSDDGVLGRGEYGVGSITHPDGDCRTCPMSQWGTAKGGTARGQACKQMRLLFVLTEEAVLPVAMFLPPTSIGPLRKYFLRLANRSMPYYSVITSLALSKASNNDGIEYSVVEPTMLGALAAEDVERIRAYSNQWQDTLAAVRIETDDVTYAEAASG